MFVTNNDNSNVNIMVSIAIILLTVYVGNIFTKSNVKSDWYNCIRPNITPSNYVFPIVWTILYVLLAVVFKNVLDSKNRVLIIIFVINLLLNVIWSYFYFGQKDVKMAFVTILLIVVSGLIILYNIDNNDRIMYVPYILWLCFATYLNYLSINNIKRCKRA